MSVDFCFTVQASETKTSWQSRLLPLLSVLIIPVVRLSLMLRHHRAGG